MASRTIRFALAALLVAAAGCSTVVVRDEPISVPVSGTNWESRRLGGGAEIPTAPLVTALIEYIRSTHVQALDAVWKGKPFTAEVVIKGDGESVTIVILAPQMRLATIKLMRPHRIEYERASRIPDAFAPEYAVVDVAFALLPTQVLANVLGTSFTVKDDGRWRELLCGSDVVRSLERRTGGEIFFVNPQAEYECTIKTLEEVP